MTQTTVRVENLRKAFGTGENEVTAVDGVSFTAESGSVVGLLGPNGAGKTTTIKLLLGLVTPDQGTVTVTGVDVYRRPSQAYDRVGAIMEGARNIYWRLTVRENLEFFAGVGGDSPSSVRERHDELLDLIGLREKADTTVNKLSRGMKQKAALASALARDVDVVFMDEPTLGLDVEAAIDLRTELRRLAESEDVTILLTSHDMDVVEAVCDRVLILQNGSIICDEAVDDLLDVFEAKQYAVTVTPPLGDPDRDAVERKFDATVRRNGDEETIEITVTEAETLYSLLKAVKSGETTLVDVQSNEPELEEVFLRFIEETETVPSDTGRAVTRSDGETRKQETGTFGGEQA